MKRYSYTIKDHTVRVDHHEAEFTVYDIASWKPEIAQYYQTLLAHSRSLDYAKEYLGQMFFQKDTSLIDGALINSAIQLLVKCFSNPSNKGSRCLDRIKVFRKFAIEIGEEDLCEIFDRFYQIRNQFIAHNQYDFKENIVGLTVENETGTAKEIAELTIQTGFLYQQNKKILLRLIHVVECYVNSQLKNLQDKIVEEYNACQIKPELTQVQCEEITMQTAW